MTTYLGKSCSFCLPRVPFVNCRQFMYLVISLFGFQGRIWDLIVSVPDHCLSFYFSSKSNENIIQKINKDFTNVLTGPLFIIFIYIRSKKKKKKKKKKKNTFFVTSQIKF